MKPKYYKTGKDGRFAASCICLNHAENKTRLINKNVVNKEVMKVLLSKKLFRETYAAYICEQCIQKNSKGVIIDDVTDNDKESVNYVTLSTNLESSISKDITSLYKERNCSDIKKLLCYDSTSWLNSRPQKLVELISTLTNLNPENDAAAMKISEIIECIYSCRNKRLVLPISLRSNLLTYSISNSKLLVNINNVQRPSGSYSYLCDWLSEHAKEEIEFPNGLVRVIFDNEQVVGKRYRVRANLNNVPCSVITSVAYLQIDEHSNIQNDEQYAPKNWLFAEETCVENENLIKGLHNYDKYFRLTRNSFIANRISKIVQEQKIDEKSEYFDLIDTSIMLGNEITSEKICVGCDSANDTTYRNCRCCGDKLVSVKFTLDKDLFREDTAHDPYSHFKSTTERKSNIQVKVGEPVMLNPSGFENIATILRTIGKKAGIKKYDEKGSRNWLLFENDGAIFTIIIKLIKNVLICPSCNESIYGIENFEDHSCAVLHSAQPDYEFDWVIIIPGLLHYEMNSAKSFMKLNWNVFMEDIVKQLGFTSENALNYIRKGNDHHKLWQILEIVYLAVTDELLIPYIRKCLEDKQEPTNIGYWIYSNTLENPNYIYIQQMIFTYLHSLMLLRSGTRNNDYDTISSAKIKLANLFFGGNHPTYRQIVYFDLVQSNRLPTLIDTIISESITGRRNIKSKSNQGGDVLLEEINKNAKKWVIGVPTNLQWQKSFRNLDNLDEVLNLGFYYLSISENFQKTLC